MLSDANRAALARVRAQALENRPRHLARIARVLEAAGAECGPGDLRGPVTLNFHPDRRLADGRSVAEVGDLQHMKYLWRLVVVYGEPG
jgi:hypothetical protein